MDINNCYKDLFGFWGMEEKPDTPYVQEKDARHSFAYLTKRQGVWYKEECTTVSYFSTEEVGGKYRIRNVNECVVTSSIIKSTRIGDSDFEGLVESTVEDWMKRYLEIVNLPLETEGRIKMHPRDVLKLQGWMKNALQVVM